MNAQVTPLKKSPYITAQYTDRQLKKLGMIRLFVVTFSESNLPVLIKNPFEFLSGYWSDIPAQLKIFLTQILMASGKLDPLDHVISTRWSAMDLATKEIIAEVLKDKAQKAQRAIADHESRSLAS